MDFVGLLTGSENLYKYCFVGGLGLIILCLFYPLNKRYELACKKDLHNKEIVLLNLEIDDLNKEYNKLVNDVDQYIDSARKSKSAKDSINRHHAIVVAKIKQIAQKEAEVEYDKNVIITLKENIRDISKYERRFNISGWFLTLVGFVGWFLLMLKKHKEKVPP
jgi:hypothetical protein